MFLQYNGQLTPISQIPTEYLREKLRTVEPGGIHHEYLTDEIAWRERQAQQQESTT